MKKERLDKRIKLSNEILLKIAEIDEMKGKWSGSLDLNPRILNQLKRSVIITSTGSSTRIEGSKMTDREVDRFLHGINQGIPKNRDEQEVAGYADLLGRIFDHYKSLLEEIIEDKQSEYYLALRRTQKNHKTINEDIEPWLMFFLDCALIQAKKALNLLKGKDPESLLSGTQKKIYNLFTDGIELRVSEIESKTGIPLPTIKASVARLTRYGLIEKLGQGPATRYRLIKR